jgi:hypothetical protein
VTVFDAAPTGWSECEVLAEAGPAVVSIKAVARHPPFGEHFFHAEGDGGLASARETCRNKLCETNKFNAEKKSPKLANIQELGVRTVESAVGNVPVNQIVHPLNFDPRSSPRLLRDTLCLTAVMLVAICNVECRATKKQAFQF